MVHLRKNNCLHKQPCHIRWVLVLATLLSLPFSVSGQVQMSLQSPPVKRLQIQDVWNIRVNNPRNMNRQVYLKATITKEDGTKVADLRTEAFNIPRGLKRLDPKQVQVTQRDFYDNNTESILKRTNNFPKGEYKISVVMHNSNKDEVLAEASITHRVTNVYANAAEVVGANQQKLVRFYGNGHIEGHSSNRQGFGQTIPQEYVRGDANATLEIGVAPVNFNGHITTMNNDLRQNANTFTVSFDDQRFINNLRNRLTNVLEEESGIKKEQYGDAINKLKKLENIDRLLENNTLEEEIKEIGSLSNIEQQLKKGDLKNAVDQINDIKKEVTDRATGLNYKAKKSKLKTELEVYQEITYSDPEKEQQRTAKTDSLRNALQELEKQRQETKAKNNEDLLKLKNLQEKQKKYEKLKEKKEKIETLLAKKEQLKKLADQKEKLVAFKEKLKASGDLKAIKDTDIQSLLDEDVLKSELIKRGMISGSEKLLYSIEELSAGTVYPYYSPLVLNGLRMTGVSFEWNPGLFYTAFSGGTSNQPRFSLENGVVDYKQRLLAGKIGVGKKHKSHLFFTVLNAIDDRNSLARNDTINTPKSNFILGTDVGLQFFNGRFKIQGEIAGSKFTDDQEASGLITNNALNEQLPGFLQPNVSSRFGLAYDVRGAFKMFKQNTIISGFLRNIDPSYNSFGAPNLRRGLFTYNAELSQKLFSRKITVSVFRKNESTTRLWQDGLTHYERQGGKIRLSFSNFPKINASYATGLQDKETIENSTSELMITGSYSYRLGKLSLSNTVSYNHNNAQSSQQQGPEYTVSNYLFNQLVSFTFPLSLSLNMNYIDETMQGTASELLVSDVSASFQILKKVNVSVGGSYKADSGESNMMGGFADISYSFANYFTFQLSYDNNFYDDLVMAGRDFNEYILNTRLSVRW